MGWWETYRNGVHVEIGDEPLDAVDSAIKKIIRAYRRDMKRKPSPDELAVILETSIKTHELELFADMDERELDGIEVRLKQRSPRQKPVTGDYFAVPLSNGGYGFGRIKDAFSRDSILVEFLDEHSGVLLGLSDLQRAPLLFECHTGTYGFELDQWLLLGNVPVLSARSGMTAKESEMFHTTRLGHSYGHEAARIVLEWYLGGQKGPKPYESRD